MPPSRTTTRHRAGFRTTPASARLLASFVLRNARRVRSGCAPATQTATGTVVSPSAESSGDGTRESKDKKGRVRQGKGTGESTE